MIISRGDDGSGIGIPKEESLALGTAPQGTPSKRLGFQLGPFAGTVKLLTKVPKASKRKQQTLIGPFPVE